MVTGSHFVIGFKSTEGAGVGVYSGRRKEEGRREKKRDC